MAINLASKFSKYVDDAFAHESLLRGATSDKVEFTGVNEVSVYSVDKMEMNDYVKSGTSRYGVIKEIGDRVQTFRIERDRSFTGSIDEGNAQDQYNVKDASARLHVQIRDVVIPETEAYVMMKWAYGAGKVVGGEAPTAETLLSLIQAGASHMNNCHVPRAGRGMFIAETYAAMLPNLANLTYLEKLGSQALTENSLPRVAGYDVHVVACDAGQAVLGQGLGAELLKVGEIREVRQHGGVGLSDEHAAAGAGYVAVVHVACAGLDEGEQGLGRRRLAADHLARAVGPLHHDIGLGLGDDDVAYLHMQTGGGVLDVVLVLGVALVDGAGEGAIALDAEGLDAVAYLLDYAVAGGAALDVVVHLHFIDGVDGDLVDAGELHLVAGSAAQEALVGEGVVHVFAELACKIDGQIASSFRKVLYSSGDPAGLLRAGW